MDEKLREQQELVTVIEEETDRLAALVDETIRMARIESGDLHLHTEPQVVASLIEASLEKLRILLEDREIRVDVAANLPEVLADAELAGLTIRQLVTNALKYSDPESPIAIAAQNEGWCVRIKVRDSGPGIAQNHLSRLFERHYRVAHNSQIPGTGMGLAIARDIVKAHGGDIRVESAPSRGSEFSFTLPVAEKR